MHLSRISFRFSLLALALLCIAPSLAATELHDGPVSTACTETALSTSALPADDLLGDVGDLGEPRTNAIQNGPCSWCNENSGCSTACIDDNGNDSDCGDYGVCDACREALVEIGRTLIGQKAKETFWSICEFKWHYNVTYRSVNSPNCQTYTRCETETETHNYLPDLDVFCCDKLAGGCFGQSCP